MTGVYVLIAISIIISIVSVIVTVLMAKKNKPANDDSVKVADLAGIDNDIKQHMDLQNQGLRQTIQNQADNARNQTERFDRFMINMDTKFDKLKDDVNRNISEFKTENTRNLEAVRKDNSEQLEKMRMVVDEKLNETLDRRFTASFKLVNDRLEELNRTFSELQNLQTGVADLNKIFSNVKTRGTWGEVSLDALLSQILTSEQYNKQFQIKKGELVDFAIVMPGKDDGSVYLPVDSKFPLEDYARLQAASESGNVDEINSAANALVKAVELQAKSISEKYIAPPKTTDFAIMYLATEGLFSEIIKRDGLIEKLQTKYRVVICGPTTIAALLNSLQMGFRSVAVEKRSTEIAKLLAAFVNDFNKFTDLLQQTNNRIDSVKKSINDAQFRTEQIQKKLTKVTQISGEQIPEINGTLPGETFGELIGDADEG
ncbi:MAG: DNA recombination protein RmuC [Clostridia bacterium]|nr:DNA recombination protein RmuC [Clostridia bacterium]